MGETMRHSEFEHHLDQVAPRGDYEALVSVSADQLRQRFSGNRAKYYVAKLDQIREVAEKIREALDAQSTVDVYEDAGQIVVSTSRDQWTNILKILDTLESNRSLRTELHTNEKIGLIR